MNQHFSKAPVIAIGLDAAEPSLIEKWMDKGYLPNLMKLRQQGVYGRLQNFKDSNVETAWTTFSTGCRPEQTGYWAAMGLREGTYETETRAAYDYQEFKPFFALGNAYRVATFDIPQLRLTNKINGLQVAAWGAHSPQVPSESRPESLFQELVAQYGIHPALHRDYAVCLDINSTLTLQKHFEDGIKYRTKICQDLLNRESWDLFLTVFGESHGGGHVFWQLSQPDHPLYEVMSRHINHDPLLSVYQSIDKSIGDILSQAPDHSRVVIFSAHGMGPAVIDLPSFIFLPELLYRYSFPGKYGLGYSKPSSPIPAPFTKMQWNYWERHIWGTKWDANPIKRFLRRATPTRIFNVLEPWLDNDPEPSLVSHLKLRRQGERVVPWNPAQWYKPMWPSMKAFAIPSFAEGYVRINLQGREPNGIVPQSDYHVVCDEICEQLYALKDARNGLPIVERIVRTRENPADRNPKLPDADLIVVWHEEHAAKTDVVESPDYGRIGPFPPYRAGSHRAEGFLLACGSGIAQNSSLENGHVLDLAPTILDLMGAPVPEHLEGKKLPLIYELI